MGVPPNFIRNSNVIVLKPMVSDPKIDKVKQAFVPATMLDELIHPAQILSE